MVAARQGHLPGVRLAPSTAASSIDALEGDAVPSSVDAPHSDSMETSEGFLDEPEGVRSNLKPCAQNTTRLTLTPVAARLMPVSLTVAVYPVVSAQAAGVEFSSDDWVDSDPTESLSEEDNCSTSPTSDDYSLL